METLVEKSNLHCYSVLSSGGCAEEPFHHVQHTQGVYRYAKLIWAYEALNWEETEPLLAKIQKV